MSRILLLMGTETYRAVDFMAAARKLGHQIVVGLDRPDPLEALSKGGTLSLDFLDLEASVERIQGLHGDSPLQAVVSVDDSATVLAARSCARLGLPANPEESVVAGANKAVFREVMEAAGLRSPWYRRYPLTADAEAASGEAPYPCVLKPLFLNASRGVIRADHPAGFVAAFGRIAAMLNDPELKKRGGEAADFLLVESFMPGAEVALEGMIQQGEFHLLAFFDKPDPLDGPFFEETLFITPSRLPERAQEAALAVAARGARALGLRTGAVHAELRLDGGEPYLLEMAPRSIGGHCSRSLRFGAGMSLEELILRQALGQTPAAAEAKNRAAEAKNRAAERESRASGVMMIPIPGAGTLHGVNGLEAARQVEGIEDVEISIPLTQQVAPLPEGHRYLGFIFAKGDTPQAVETALRESQGKLTFRIG